MNFQHLLYNHALAMEHLAVYYQENENYRQINETTDAMLECLKLGGKLIFVGCGKSFKLVCKTVATLTSLGIRARELHPIEAMHGDIGICDESDLIVFCSTSGETDEVVNLMHYMSEVESPWSSCIRVAVTGNAASTLAIKSHHIVQIPQPERFKEQTLQAGLKAPTVSTTLMLTILDCICIHLSHLWFHRDNTSRELFFNIRHPGGGIGKSASSSDTTLPKILPSPLNSSSVPHFLSHSIKNPSSLSQAQFLSLLIDFDYLFFPSSSQPVPTSVLRAEHRLAAANGTLESWFAQYLDPDHSSGHIL